MMIRKRAEWASGSPPPPPWLDPERLGADKLRFVPFSQVFVINGGKLGIVEFLRRVASEGLDETFQSLPLLRNCQAFLVMRPDVGTSYSYVFSREEFWLAAYAFLNDRAREGLRETLGRFGPMLEAMPWHPGVLDNDSTAQEAVEYAFDIHEHGASEEPEPGGGAPPDRPALLRNNRGRLTGVVVPDTRRRYGATPARRPSLPRPVRGTRRTRGTRGAKGAKGGGETPRSRGLGLGMARDAETLPTSDADELLHRTPHMDLSKPEPLQPGDEFNVTVYADETAARPGERTEGIEIRAPREVREFQIGICLTGTTHFAIVEPLKSLLIKRDEARSSEVTFKVLVLRETNAPDVLPTLTASFCFDSRPCGQVSRTLQLAGVASAEDAPAEPTRPAKLDIDLSARPADLLVQIVNPNRDGRTFHCLLSTPNFGEPATEDWVLPTATGQLVAEFFQLFTASNQSKGQRLAGLIGAGEELFRTAPKCFQDRFWQMLDAGKPPRTISIVSEEPFIPWELMIPTRERPGAPLQERDPLGVEFAVGRWISEDHTLRQAVPLSDSWVFAPNYPPVGRGPKPLVKAAEEAQFVQAKFPGAMISPAVFDEFQAALAGPGRSLLHFVCHGISGGGAGQSIYCEDSTALNSIALGGMRGVRATFAAKKPFVFLNACEVGRETPALVGVGGFAAKFLQMGASCVIAPLWSVRDVIAHEIAQEFYNQTVADPAKPFAEIIRSIRARAYAAGGGEDTYAAYCFYGDPLASQRN